MTQTTLDQQIAELTAKHNLQLEVESKFPGLKVNTIFSNRKDLGTTKLFWVKLEDCPLHEIKDNIQRIISAFPPTAKAMIYKGSKYEETASNFLLRWDNGIRDRKAQIEYVSGEFNAHIDLPVSFFSDDVKGPFHRKVYDTEHHYFGGVSMAEINRMQILAYKLDMFENMQYYGGDCTSYIKDAEDRAEFESVVFTGHVPEFSEFWQKQLASL
jgi:hypothetical protein